ncbi:MAG: nodulation protein NfeD, partial [bacterium]
MMFSPHTRPWRVALLGTFVVGLALSSASAATPTPRPIALLPYSGVINPVASEYVDKGLEKALALGAQALVLQLDTPGGLDRSMRLIIKSMLASPIPVVVYVAPSGSRAASAG